MKRDRFFAPFFVMLLAACATSGDEGAGGALGATAAEGDGLVMLPAAAVVAVRETAGLTATRGRPVFEPDREEPAFFEVATPEGWAVVTADADAHVVEYGAAGPGPTARLDLGGRAGAMARLYRLDAAIYVATDATGHALGRSTRSLLRVERSGDQAAFVEVSSDEALATFHAAKTARSNVVQGKKDTRTRSEDGAPTWTRSEDGAPRRGLRPRGIFGDDPPPAKTCHARGEVPSYSQLDAGEGPNDTGCASGCGPTAWATIFGWASKRAAGDPVGDGAFGFLFPDAPATMNARVGALSMEINRAVGTFCVAGQGATAPWSMDGVTEILAQRAPLVDAIIDYDSFLIADDGVRDVAIEALCAGRPVIVGTGTLFAGDGHYPIAKAYANGRFELEMGWGGAGNGWYDATTWFAGSIARF